MSAKRHSKEDILETLQNLARNLGQKSLSTKEVAKVISPSTINYHFGSVGNALEAAGLVRGSSTQHLDQFRKRLSDDDLFKALVELETELGHEPRYPDINARGQISHRPYKRFGRTWDDVLKSYRKWKSDIQHSLIRPATQPNGDTAITVMPTPQSDVELRTLAAPAAIQGQRA